MMKNKLKTCLIYTAGKIGFTPNLFSANLVQKSAN